MEGMEGMEEREPTVDAVIAGAGLAGLRCARTLAARGLEVRLFEASDRPGGRIRTDRVDGFLLDRGFQVFLTSYPEARDALRYPPLDLRPFLPGAMVRRKGRFHEVADPFRRPGAAPGSLLAPVGSLLDKLRMARLRWRLLPRPHAELHTAPDVTTREALEEEGFSDAMVEAFLRPFLGGVFLDPELRTSRRMLDFVLRMFATGEAALPAKGMEAIPRQLAGALPDGVLRTGRSVAGVAPDRVRLDGGREVAARAVVVATDGEEAGRLLEDAGIPLERPRFLGVRCLYFDAPVPPVRKPILVLDGEGEGPVNHLAVPSQVASGYAPEGRSLVSVTVLDGVEEEGDALEGAVRTQLRGWFGPGVDGWRLLRGYRIERALPSQPPGWLEPPQRPVATDGLFVCGDHRDDASINGALQSGRRCADAVCEALGIDISGGGPLGV